jgi:hypothetical protein
VDEEAIARSGLQSVNDDDDDDDDDDDNNNDDDDDDNNNNNSHINCRTSNLYCRYCQSMSY